MSTDSPATPPDASSSDAFPFGQDIVWTPDPDTLAESNLRAFMDAEGIENYDALMRRATEDVAWFWDAALRDLDIQFYEAYDEVLDTSEGGIERPRWCTGGKLNIVHNLIDKWKVDAEKKAQEALRWEGEDGQTQTITYDELEVRVCRCAGALAELGIGKGDPVGLYMPMIPQTVVAFLAIAKAGAIILPLFSGYGPGAIATRLQSAGAKALFCADGFTRRKRPITMKENVDEALATCPTVEHVVLYRHLPDEHAPDVTMTDGRDHFWSDLVPRQDDFYETTETSAEDPLMLIYTSGTTGAPKGAVHSHCGFPVKAAQDMRHSMDLKEGETMYWMSDMGWMMGPWLVFGTLINGATMVLYDGAPDHPGPGRLWQLCEDHGVTHLGLSPTLVRALKGHGTGPVEGHDLSALRAACSTGSPWDPESWTWLFEEVLGGEKPILNYSGGTEISGGILCGNFFEPLAPCAFSGPVPGMDADVVGPDGEPVREEVGELAIRQPWIGMTRGFWGDEDDERYLDSYWRCFEGLWVHGDFAAVDEHGLWYILGRSGDTINVAGKRLGPAEVEAAINTDDAVAESAAVGVPHEVKGQEVVAFAVLNDGNAPSDDLRGRLMERVTRALGKPLRPREILFAGTLPKTRNAKVMRRVIRAAYLGEDPGDTSSLEDPSTVEAVRNAV
ncbi:MAG: AMP-dependent synthetase [Bacteroidetes bacterium QS_9_68_14]|nr:MAG: AMP-dependent synthetase [Bacteroidetes bacterium QS_9_68_14]